jgi:multiple sugar transport system permease protein
LTLLSVFFLFPVVFMIVSSLKPDTQIFKDLSGLRAFLPTGEISLDTTAACSTACPRSGSC